MRKWRKTVCLVSVLLVAAAMLFSFERRPNGGMAMLCGGIFLILLTMPVLTLVWAFRDWKRIGVLAIFPFGLSILIFPVSFKAADLGFHQRIAEFRGHLPEYEGFIAGLAAGTLGKRDGIKVGEWKKQANRPDSLWIDLRDTPYRHLGYAAVAERKSNGVLTLRFLLCVWLNGHHRKYVYRSDGDFENALTEREQPGVVVNKHWRAVSD